MRSGRRIGRGPSPEFLDFARELHGTPVHLGKHPAKTVLRPSIAYIRNHFSAQVLRSCPLRNSKGALFKPEMHYISGPGQPNAVIQKVGNIHCIGVFDVICQPFDEVSRFLFSRRNVLSFIGDASREIDPPWPLTTPLGIASWTSPSQAKHLELMASMVPKCPVRQAYCNRMTADMIEFVWLHEGGHGTEGHADYIQATFGALPLFELDPPRSQPLGMSRTDRQLIELAADERASTIFLSEMILDHLAGQHIAGLSLTRGQWAIFRLVAIVMVFYCLSMIEMGRDKRDIFKIDKMAQYPTSFIRLVAQLAVLHEHSRRRLLGFERIADEIGLALQELWVIVQQHQYLRLVLKLDQIELLRQFIDYFNELAKDATVRTNIEHSYQFAVAPRRRRGAAAGTAA
jgi:hypothetical protein